MDERRSTTFEALALSHEFVADVETYRMRSSRWTLFEYAGMNVASSRSCHPWLSVTWWIAKYMYLATRFVAAGFIAAEGAPHSPQRTYRLTAKGRKALA